MKRERGVTLLELLFSLSIATVCISSAFLLYGSERLASRADEAAFRESAAVAEVLDSFSEDARRAARVVPRAEGIGAVVLFPDGSAAVWFDREGEPGALHRKLLRPAGKPEQERVVARGVGRFALREEGRLVTATVTCGGESRSLTVRRRP